MFCATLKHFDLLMVMYLSLRYLHAHQDLFLAAQLGEREQSLSHGQLLHYFLAQHLQVTQHVHGQPLIAQEHLQLLVQRQTDQRLHAQFQHWLLEDIMWM
jgi:hypothetical protein